MAEFRVRLGETAAVRPRWWGKSWSITYAGAPCEGAYSVAVTWTMGNNSAAYNLYLRREQREFALPIGRVRVLEVSPTEIRLQFDNPG